MLGVGNTFHVMFWALGASAELANLVSESARAFVDLGVWEMLRRKEFGLLVAANVNSQNQRLVFCFVI